MSGSYVEKLIAKAKMSEFDVHLIYNYIYINSIDLVQSRIDRRIKAGGHNIERDKIATRLIESRLNFYERYKNIADSWDLYCNSGNSFICITSFNRASDIAVHLDADYWEFVELCERGS